MLPFFLLGVPAGAVADRFDRRHMVSIVNIAMAALIAALGLLIMRDLVGVWHLAAFGFAGGCLRAINMPARQSLAYDIVGGGNVVNGLALMSMGMRVGAIAGSLSAGSLMARLGADAACATLAVGYVLAAITIMFIRDRGQAAPVVREPVWQNLKGFWSELRQNRSLQMLVVLSAMAEILGFSHQVLMPTLAKDILDVGAEGLGVMNAVRSVGGILAILMLSAMGDIRRKGTFYLFVLLIFGFSLIFLGFADTFYLAILGITLVNGLGALSDILSQSLVQSVVPNEFRGRAMGSWTLAVGMGAPGPFPDRGAGGRLRGDIRPGDSRGRTSGPGCGRPGPLSQIQKVVDPDMHDRSWRNRDPSQPATPITMVGVRRVLGLLRPVQGQVGLHPAVHRGDRRAGTRAAAVHSHNNRRCNPQTRTCRC